MKVFNSLLLALVANAVTPAIVSATPVSPEVRSPRIAEKDWKRGFGEHDWKRGFGEHDWKRGGFGEHDWKRED